MNYYEFKKQYSGQGVFSLNSIERSSDNSLSSNLRRWKGEEKILHIRQGWYLFPEESGRADVRMAAAGKIYCPSYLSLEYVLSWYEIIPETVLALTSVSTLKTAVFDTPIGYYSYRHVSPNLFFGYKPLQPRDGLPALMATPEKALLDLLYFHPEYKSDRDMENLRLDRDAMREEFDWKRFRAFLERFDNRALSQRAAVMENTYA